MADDDLLHRFIFDNSDVRGEIISLSDSYSNVLANGNYPEAINRLLGELLAAAGLLSATMKFDGVFSLQARGDGDLNLLMADCTRQNSLRGIARVRDGATPTSTELASLLGTGHLTITIDPAEGERYQGIVPLEKGTLNGCLEDYFELSEQLPTRLWLFADGQRAAGLLLQALPLQTQSQEQRDSYWQHLCVLADTLTGEEMLSLDNTTILNRLFHQESLRLFESRPLQFACSCSESRTGNMLVSLGRDEVQAILDEQGKVSVQCQFCHQQYLFDQEQVDVLFAPQRILH
ncbi:MAG: Hsp33 family molecular chaperone HslO [Bacteroidales bacterium]|nr:Hsp33 family molecular chaperone HslO [Bacteroidales bacterium]